MNQSQLYALYETDPAPVASFLKYLVESYGLGEEPRVLDMGCGPGRV